MSTTQTLPYDATHARNHRSPEAPPSEYPLLEWVATELRNEFEIDQRSAWRAARRLLEDAFAAIDRHETPITHKELSR
jgi:hypothetical protein